MKWWKKPLIATGILIICIGAFGFVMHRQIVKTAPNAQTEDNRGDKLGTICGEIFGAGMVVVWVVAYKTKGNK